VPVFERELSSDDGGVFLGAIVHDFEQVLSRGIIHVVN
jgi:hypothetical protein